MAAALPPLASLLLALLLLLFSALEACAGSLISAYHKQNKKDVSTCREIFSEALAGPRRRESTAELNKRVLELLIP